MAGVYEEVPLDKMTFDEHELAYTYQCPCGDVFRIFLEELHDGESIAPCDSCTLKLRVLYKPEELPPLPDEPGDLADASAAADD
mmetsp:Transcript_18847/g.71345  ORF Transcript_18847/g.71345 Transcript_18847/m.71345 type:complete len:84 (+) Transcript_18847:129-380(+)|eukprot:scaffold40_cov305-Pinguiococcus_pyrenoidosus.AAC.7